MAMYKPRVFPLRLTETDYTADSLRQFMADNEIPGSAEFVYRGCGSHDMEFHWMELLSPEDEQAERERRAALRAATEARERQDRELGF
jgi:hypothetical protein